MEDILALRKERLENTFNKEKDFSYKLIKNKNPLEFLKEFPEFENYVRLTNIEWYSLCGCDIHNSHKNLLFLGGGPLPISAILYALQFNLNVLVLDINKEAIEIAEKVIKKLGLEEKISFKNISAEEFKDYDKFEVIVIAAMAGIEESDKKNILNQIKKRISSKIHIIARTSHSNIYPKFSPEIYNGFSPILEVRPLEGFVNSIIILRN